MIGGLEHPTDMRIAARRRQNRLPVAFRIALALGVGASRMATRTPDACLV